MDTTWTSRITLACTKNCAFSPGRSLPLRHVDAGCAFAVRGVCVCGRVEHVPCGTAPEVGALKQRNHAVIHELRTATPSVTVAMSLRRDARGGPVEAFPVCGWSARSGHLRRPCTSKYAAVHKYWCLSRRMGAPVSQPQSSLWRALGLRACLACASALLWRPLVLGQGPLGRRGTSVEAGISAEAHRGDHRRVPRGLRVRARRSGAAGGVRFAFYGRVSMEGHQDPATSKA